MNVTISVVIPTFNAQVHLHSLFECLAQQECISDKTEIIFVDNGSTDNTRSLLTEFCSDHSFATYYSYTKKQSSYACRNFGVKKASGTVLVFTDADCRPDRNWIKNIKNGFENSKGFLLLTGPVVLYPSGSSFNPFEWYDRCISLDQERYSKTQTGATANLSVSRGAYEQVGGFKELISGSDRDFCRRVGLYVDSCYEFNKKIVVLHPARATRYEIRKKADRLAVGLAQLNWGQSRSVHKVMYAVKTLAAMIVQFRQWQIAYSTLIERGLGTWTIRFIFTAFREGFYARRRILVEYIRIMG